MNHSKRQSHDPNSPSLSDHWRRQIWLFSSGELSTSDRRDVEAYLKGSKEAANYLAEIEQMRSVIPNSIELESAAPEWSANVLNTAIGESLPSKVFGNVDDMAKKEKTTSKTGPQFNWIVKWAMALAASIAILFVGFNVALTWKRSTHRGVSRIERKEKPNHQSEVILAQQKEKASRIFRNPRSSFRKKIQSGRNQVSTSRRRFEKTNERKKS